MARLRFLGTGTSDGIPRLGCPCATCTSDDPRDRRLRTSALVSFDGDDGQPRRLVIDAGMDFRQQALAAGITRLDAVLLTHAHVDHIEGVLELRPLSLPYSQTIPIRGNTDTIEELFRRFSFIFEPVQVGGGLPLLDPSPVDGPFTLLGKHIVPLPVKHGILDILGYRLGELAWITDASAVPDTTMELLRGVDVLVVNTLRARPHATHFNYDESVAFARAVDARQTWFVHMDHERPHAELVKVFPAGMAPAVDGQELEFAW